MIVSFKLSMPRSNSWNGKWSGEGRVYCILKTFRGAKQERRAEKLISDGPYWYSWSDGWGAQVSVSHVSSTEARSLRKSSVGFAGYDWMVRSILDYGKIMADHEIREHLAKQREEVSA